MGQFSVEKPGLPGSALSGNQQAREGLSSSDAARSPDWAKVRFGEGTTDHRSEAPINEACPIARAYQWSVQGLTNEAIELVLTAVEEHSIRRFRSEWR
jgi:hypothetical protein